MVLNEVQYPQILLLDPLAGSKCQGSGWVIFLGSVSSQQKFEATDVKPSVRRSSPTVCHSSLSFI